MPANKSKRIASRQAQLSGRSRHTRPHGPSGIPQAGAPDQTSSSQAQTTTSAVGATPPTEPATQPAPRRQTPTPTARTGSSRRSNPYILPPEVFFGREMRRIGIVVGSILALLVVLTFLLR